MRTMPFPCAANDLLQQGVARLPAKFGTNLVRRSDQDGRVAGAARADHAWDRVAGDRAGRLNHFKISEAVAVAKIVGPATEPIKRFERQGVGLGQISDMN